MGETRQQLDDWSISSLLREQPGLRLAPSANGAVRLAGTLSFSAQKPGCERIDDAFEVEIEVPFEFPQRLPVVKETGRRIPPKFHKNDGLELCLGSPTRQMLALREAPTLSAFVSKCVIPYLYGFVHHVRHGQLPFGELAHGRKGLLDDFRSLFGVKTDEAAVEMVRLASMKKRDANKRRCPCGSGRRLGRCHNRTLNGLRRKLGRNWFAGELYALTGS